MHPTATDLIDELRTQREARDAADVAILRLAVQWADRHTIDPTHAYPSPGFLEPPPVPGDVTSPAAVDEAIEWLGLPTLHWHAAASFAAALGMSTGAGKALIRDALTLAVRLPRVWARLQAGEVQAWRARRIAQAALGQPDDVAAYLDQETAPVAATIGPVLLDRLLDKALLLLHAEEREIDHREALDARYARLDSASINHTGIADLHVRGDWADVAAFDDALSDVAAALKRNGSPESLDVRRSMAVGILADPELAAAMLDGDNAPVAPKRAVELIVHLNPTHLRGLAPVLTDADQRPLLDQQVREWCGRRDRKVVVRPVRHCGGCPECADHATHVNAGHTATYQPTVAVREVVELRDRTCVFPHCNRPARACDADHIDPFGQGGPTCPCNLAALCRHHHRLKTHAGWQCQRLGPPGAYLWTDRYDQAFLRTSAGTADLGRASPR